MKKHIPTALAVIAALAITVIALGAANAQEPTAQTLVPAELTQTLGDGQTRPLGEDSAYEDMLKTKLTSEKSDKYLYLFESGSGELKAVMLTDNAVQTESPVSESAAAATAQKIVSAAFPGMDLSSFDAKCRYTGSGWTVELWEKLADDLYGGRKIAVTLSEGGELETLVRTDTDTGDWQSAASSTISREKAAELALTAIDGDAENAEVSAYKEVRTDGIIWQVDIANVDIGDGFTVTYFVTLNALTGEVILVDMTR